ncbi:MAG: site-specific tyrosine recombinase XerD [Streptococcaceae bacterium]|jgi:integrase|nr:site-specific tyrosine recombinase XerD [Streptococcaceae bacterium]
MIFKSEITRFLAQKPLSNNSRQAYTYDLKQFCDFFETREINATTLDLFQKQIAKLAPAAQKRKTSTANQFLSFLYQERLVSDYFQLKKNKIPLKKSEIPPLRDFSTYYGPIQSTGQFLACLILQTGLTPAEIGQISWSDFNWRFNVLTLTTGGIKRNISLEPKFAVRAKTIQNADELFHKTRQYLHLELKKFTPYTARELREQYILRCVKEKRTIYMLAETLGLKTTATLEKYYK